MALINIEDVLRRDFQLVLWRAALIVLSVVTLAGLGLGIGLTIENATHPPTEAVTTSETTKLGRLFERASSAQAAGNPQLARRDYLAVLSLDPLDSYAYYDLGVLYQDAKQLRPSEEAYSRALVTNPTLSAALFNLAILESSRNAGEAKALYLRLESLEPTDASAYFNLGLLYRTLGDAQLSREQLSRAFTLEPSLQARLTR